MTSCPKISGMPSRLCSTAMCCSLFRITGVSISRGTVEKRTDFAALQLVGERFVRVCVIIHLPELADFFVQRHPLQQIVDALGDRLRRVFVNVLPPVLVRSIQPCRVVAEGEDGPAW